MSFPEDEHHGSAEFPAPVVLPLVAPTAVPLLLSPQPLLQEAVWHLIKLGSLGSMSLCTHAIVQLMAAEYPAALERALCTCPWELFCFKYFPPLFSKVSWKQQCLKKANKGDCRGGWRPSSNCPSFYRWAEASALRRCPWNGHQDLLSAALTALTEPERDHSHLSLYFLHLSSSIYFLWVFLFD